MRESYTILLADDDPDDQELIVHALTEVSPSFNLHIVNDGKEAIEFLTGVSDDKLPCLIVLDYNMPELTGAQVLHMLTDNRWYNKIPKIIFSTSGNPQYMEDCMQKGAAAYKVKPDNYTQLLLIAREMLELCGKEIIS